jgi:hypothetical protein
MNSWDTPAFRDAINATGKKNVLLSGCITWPMLNMLADADSSPAARVTEYAVHCARQFRHAHWLRRIIISAARKSWLKR